MGVSVGYKTVGSSAGRNHGYTAGVNLSVPLGGDGSGEAAKGRIQAERGRSREHLWTVRHDAGIRQAFVRARRLVEVATSASEHLAHGHTQLLAGARLAYEGGELDLDGWLEAHADARDDRLEALQLAQQAWLAHIELERLAGGAP